MLKNLPVEPWKRHRGEIVAAQWDRPRLALISWRGEAARATIRGQLASLVGLRDILRKRAAIQANRRVDEAYIESLLVSASDGSEAGPAKAENGQRRLRPEIQVHVPSKDDAQKRE